MTIAPSGPLPPSPPPRSPGLLERLPWEKVLIWGLFLVGIYELRDLFFVIFMTFLFSFVVRSVVLAIAQRLSPKKERAWLERGLTLVTFLVMLAGVTVVFSYLGPRIFEQSRALLVRLQGTHPQEAMLDFRNRTVGAYLLSRRIGKPGDEPYEQAFRDYQEQGLLGEGIFHIFPSLRDDLTSAFEAGYEGTKRLQLQEELIHSGPVGHEFEDWFLANKAPEMFDARSDYYIDRWSDGYTPGQLARMAEQPDYMEQRESQILRRILLDVEDDAVKYEAAVEEWKDKTIAQRWRALRESPGYTEAFRAYFEERQAKKPDIIPFNFDTYETLSTVYPDKGRFVEILAAQTIGSIDRDPQVATRDFRLTLQEQLAEEWWKNDPIALWVRTQIREDLPKLVSAVGDLVQSAIREAATIPIYLATALMLTIFITFDMPRLKRGVRRLHTTRLKNIYVEIAPGLVTFARLIGRAFAAQGLIAVFNTLLTYMLLWLLGIENEFFLCTIVFLCSFIPILGVILSSVPIALMAVLQPGGSLWLALQAIAGIVIIHLIETSILNPKILGDMLHMHPVMVLAILTVGEHFFGIWGLLLGVPIGVFVFRIVILKEQIPGITDRPAAIPEASPSHITTADPPGAAPKVIGDA